MGIVEQGQSPSITVGGRVFTDLENLIILSGATGTSSADYATARLEIASSGYQVPASKVLKILAVKVWVGVASQAALFGAGYGDNDVGLASSSQPTNLVTSNLRAVTAANQGAAVEFATDISVPATKYPAGSDGNSSVACYFEYFCYLKDV